MRTKKLFSFFLVVLCITPLSLSAQKKEQPSIMVMPADQWCIDHGFYNTYEDPQSGKTKKTPAYREAFQENQKVSVAMSKIGEMFNERGFPLKNMEEKLDQLEKDQAMDAAEGDGRGTKSTLKEQLLQNVKSDIVLYLNWEVKEEGPYKQLTFQLDAVDPYIAENVGNVSGTGDKSNGNLNVLLEEAVLEHVTNLQSQMQDYFDDLNENGRKIRMRLKVAQGSQYNLKDYCSSKEKYPFGQIYEDAVMFESVDKAYKIGTNGKTRINFDLIRIPMFYERETAFGTSEVSMSAMDFAKVVNEKVLENCPRLSKDRINITGLGLGQASITITPK